MVEFNKSWAESLSIKEIIELGKRVKRLEAVLHPCCDPTCTAQDLEEVRRLGRW